MKYLYGPYKLLKDYSLEFILKYTNIKKSSAIQFTLKNCGSCDVRQHTKKKKKEEFKNMTYSINLKISKIKILINSLLKGNTGMILFKKLINVNYEQVRACGADDSVIILYSYTLSIADSLL